MAGFDGPVAVGRVDIGMAYSTGLDLDDDFAWSRCWFREVFDYEWFVERVNDGCFHLLSPSHWLWPSIGTDGEELRERD